MCRFLSSCCGSFGKKGRRVPTWNMMLSSRKWVNTDCVPVVSAEKGKEA